MKLIRHLIPGIVAAKGESIRTRSARPDEVAALAGEKLDEEVMEYFESGQVDELVDIIEACFAASRFRHGVSPHELLEMCEAKAKERGTLQLGIVLLEDDDEVDEEER